MTTTTLDSTSLGNWLWDAACQIRGAVDAPKFRDYILPLVFVKRLSDVFDDEVDRLAVQVGNRDTALFMVDADHNLVRFFVPEDARWKNIGRTTTGLGEYLTTQVRAITTQNPELKDVIDITDFNATTAGERIIDDGRLASLIQVLGKHRLGIGDVEPDILGRAYEYLLRKFAEGQGQSAGEFYTPREVAILLARLMNPQPGESVYDPCCGSGGLLIKCHLRLLESHGEQKNGVRELPANLRPLALYGQERIGTVFAMARMNGFIHDMRPQIALGDTMMNPAFTQAGRLRTSDIVVSNPMWNQDFSQAVYENDSYDRFSAGYPPSSSADWGWLQHMLASVRPGGRMAVVLDTGSVSRGSGHRGSNRERKIRARFVQEDLIECVILLPENLFFNTTAPAVIVVVNRAKKHRGEVLLINASQEFSKGRPKNYLDEEQHVPRIIECFRHWSTKDAFSAVVNIDELVRDDFNLSPSRYVSSNGKADVLPLEEAVDLLRESEEERSDARRRLGDELKRIGINL